MEPGQVADDRKSGGGIFSRLYDWMLRASRHRHARWYLALVSFAESSFFPIPPDVMLAPMTLAQPKRSWSLAGLTTLASTVGGMFGYLIGYFLIGALQPVMDRLGYRHGYDTVVEWFAEYGFWAMLLAGFTPIPYKLFTIAAGANGMAFLPFVAGSTIGRGGRFFLVAALVRLAGPTIENRLVHYIDLIGWSVLGLIAAGGVLYGVMA